MTPARGGIDVGVVAVWPGLLVVTLPPAAPKGLVVEVAGYEPVYWLMLSPYCAGYWEKKGN